MSTDRQIKTIKDIINNYSNLEKSIVKQLNFQVLHGPTIGGFREEIWKSLFEQIIPKKFSIERSVFIIDSKGNVSNEVDLAIFDEQYTPYIFRYGTLKFIPIEAVAVVIECKSETIKIENWCKSIDKLTTSKNSIARMAGQITSGGTATQSATRPIKILCYVKDKEDSQKSLKESFDFIIRADQERLLIHVNEKLSTLSDWHKELNHADEEECKNDFEETKDKNIKDYNIKDYSVKNDDGSYNSILTLIFQLNQLLILINNPLLFPHMAYVNLFNNIDNKIDAKEIEASIDIKSENKK